jgi:hypothetical protein
MSTVQAFNTMLKNFLEELAEVFPEETQIAVFLEGFDSLTAINARAPMDMFVESLAPHSALAMAKNPELFEKIKFPGGIDFGKLWQSDISDNTRDAIWQYINLLFLLGSTVRSMPVEMLQGIESVAQSCAEKIENGQLDFSALGSMLMGGALGGGGLGGALGALGGLGGLGEALGSAQQQQPRAKRKSRK